MNPKAHFRWNFFFFVLGVLGFILIPLPSSHARSFYENEVQGMRASWFLLTPETVVQDVFADALESDEGDDVKTSHDYRIEISLPARRMYVFHHEDLVKTYPVAIGSARYRTPIGPRHLVNITWNPWWYPPPYSDWAKGAKPTPPGPGNPLGRVKMSLGGDIFVHGTNKEYTVGQAASHGCMRMKNKDAMELAWFFQQRFTDQTDEDLQAKYKKYPTSSFYVPLKEKIPVNVVYDRVRIEDKHVVIQPDVYGRGQELKTEVVSELAAVGIPIWDMNEPNLEELKRLPGTFSVAIADLLVSTK